MPYLIVLHLLKNRAAASVARIEPLKVTPQVRFDLVLGLCDEPQAGSVTKRAGQGSDHEGASVPQRVEHARAPLQFAQALLAPPQMVGFFLCRLLHCSFDGRISGRERLSLVERLGGDLTGMIDAHQTC